MRISNSFSEGEIQVLVFILQTLLRGGTPSMATRNKDFASVYRKVMTMKKRVEEIESGKYNEMLRKLTEMSKEDLEKLYLEREREPDLAPPGAWMPEDTQYL